MKLYKNMLITPNLLRRISACYEARRAFRRIFRGKGARLTKENLEKWMDNAGDRAFDWFHFIVYEVEGHDLAHKLCNNFYRRHIGHGWEYVPERKARHRRQAALWFWNQLPEHRRRKPAKQARKG